MDRYEIEIEIFEGEGGQLRKDGDEMVYPNDLSEAGICAWMYRGDGEKSYQVGQRFRYPEDAGKLCPWLLGSMHSALQTLQGALCSIPSLIGSVSNQFSSHEQIHSYCRCDIRASDREPALVELGGISLSEGSEPE